MPEKKRSSVPSKSTTTKPRSAETAAAPPRRAPARAPRKAAAKAAPTPEAPLSILMVASEAHPFASTGGLADVVASLSDALARLGHRVTYVMPRYRRVDVADATARGASIRLGWRDQPVTFRERVLGSGVTAVFVDVPELFDRDELYGAAGRDYDDNAWRFAVLARAALEHARATGERPSVIHTHDWQAGLVPVFQKMQFSSDAVVGGVPAVFTIHNLAFQGLFPVTTIPTVGLGWDVLHVDALEYWGQVSYLKGGVNFSEKITTVSPTYAREITQRDLGFGFAGILARRSADLVGILNGIDTARWNPAADPLIAAPYDAKRLAGKAANKRALLERVGLPTDASTLSRPLIGVISRLTDQKGFDLIATGAADLMALDATWVMLGSGEPAYERLWRDLAAQNPRSVSSTIGFDDPLAHFIEAGADIFLMPSRFEPCGLNQMYSLRYGTVPIVRATGGLDDTIRDVADGPGGNGFKFREYTAAAMVQALRRAVESFRNRSAWRKIQQTGMAEDHSWDVSAREYVKVYRDAGAPLAP